MTDLEADPLVMLQHRHYLKCFVVAAFLLPSLVPTLWGEDITNAYFIAVLRYVAVLHFTWLVNSAAHMYLDILCLIMNEMFLLLGTG